MAKLAEGNVIKYNRRATDLAEPPALAAHFKDTTPYLDITYAIENAYLDSAADISEAKWKTHLVSCVQLWNALTEEQHKKTEAFWESAQSIAPMETPQNVSGS